jgi:3-dehydroquinate dehydratase-2
MLGQREPAVYGSFTLTQLNSQIEKLGHELNVSIEFFQSNHEGVIVDKIHSTLQGDVSGILINAAAYTHTSIAIRDALLAVGIPFVEVHLTNIYKRESFRHLSYLSDIAIGVVSGLGKNSYLLGLRGLVEVIG